MTELRGVIARLVPEKGYGFIRRTDSPAEYFFHRAELDGGVDFSQLRPGLVVTFEENLGSTRGPRARRVVVIA